MSAKIKGKLEAVWYNITRELIGLDYDPSQMDFETYRGIMPCPEGYHKDYEIGKEDPPEGHVDTTPLGKSIIMTSNQVADAIGCAGPSDDPFRKGVYYIHPPSTAASEPRSQPRAPPGCLPTAPPPKSRPRAGH